MGATGKDEHWVAHLLITESYDWNDLKVGWIPNDYYYTAQSAKVVDPFCCWLFFFIAGRLMCTLWLGLFWSGNDIFEVLASRSSRRYRRRYCYAFAVYWYGFSDEIPLNEVTWAQLITASNRNYNNELKSFSYAMHKIQKKISHQTVNWCVCVRMCVVCTITCLWLGP